MEIKQFAAIERTYVDGETIYTVFHPAIKF